jgi:hypothetical protein
VHLLADKLPAITVPGVAAFSIRGRASIWAAAVDAKNDLAAYVTMGAELERLPRLLEREGLRDHRTQPRILVDGPVTLSSQLRLDGNL